MKNKRNPEIAPPFPTATLSSFQFGDRDGKFDDVLLHSPIMVRGAREFLAGNKSIVLGERGAGKSALFKLIAQGIFKFAELQDKSVKPLVVAIDDEIKYLAVANAVHDRFEDRASKPNGKYLFMWEIYILMSVVHQLNEAYPGDEEARTLEEDLAEVLGVQKAERKQSLLDLFGRFKLSVGTKFEQSGAFTPNISIEPVNKLVTAVRHVTDHEISQFRERARKFVKSKKRIVYVLVDGVDDFVTDQEYEEQRKNVQALVDCIKSYRYPELKLKVFLRADIYNKLNFERGADKLTNHVVRLEWTADDICEFVARRLMYNFRTLDIKLPVLGLNLDLLDVDPSVRHQISELVMQKPDSVGHGIKLLGRLFYLVGKIKITGLRKKEYAARKTNSMDGIFEKLITLVFPTRIAHLSSQCKREEMQVKEYLGTHFCLGGTGPNPRLVLSFIQRTFEEAGNYYYRNPDKKTIVANALNEYELLLNEHTLAAYRHTQLAVRDTLAKLNVAWTVNVERLFAARGRPNQCSGLTLKNIKDAAQWRGDDDDFRRFVAFFHHVGLLEDETKGNGTQYQDRKYSLPTVVRICG